MKLKYSSLQACAIIAGLFCAVSVANAKPKNQPTTDPNQGFAVLGGTAVTITSSVGTGDVGVDLGGAFTQTSSTISGTVHLGDLVAQNAYDDFLLA